jgi:hypothetical protein
MRIITTILALLMASSLFAEAWVCTFLVPSSSKGFYQEIYTRSGDHFVKREGGSSPVRPSQHTIAYEDEFLLVLHWTRLSLAGSNDRTTFVEQINKSNRKITGLVLDSESGFRGNSEGTCEVVE